MVPRQADTFVNCARLEADSFACVVANGLIYLGFAEAEGMLESTQTDRITEAHSVA